MNLIETITEYLTKLVENRIGLSILVGLIFSLALTQWAKFVLLHTAWVSEKGKAPDVWVIKAVALPVGAVPTFLILPDSIEWVVRVLIGVSVGAVAPYAYRVIVAVLPDSISQRLSVDPYGDKE